MAQVEVHVIERDDAGEALRDLAELEEKSTGVTGLVGQGALTL
jgi:hypothetical protein